MQGTQRNSILFFTFWINQDTVIDESAFKKMVNDALAQGINKGLALQDPSAA